METAILKSAEILKSIKPLEEEEVDSDMNKNLYTHIKYLLKTKYAMNDNEKFDDLFEDISLRLKAYGYYLKDDDDLSSDYIQKLLKEPQIIENILNEYNKEKLLLKPPAKVEEGAEPQPITSINFIPDYYELFQKFGSIGINFSKKELLLLNKSLTKLATILTTGNITFFGKFFGTEKDYYIVEATEIDPPENFNYDNDMEKRKEDGINKNVFYATNDLSEKWIELPDVKPSQIIASRKIRYQFTGDLKRVLYTNPHFNGQEQHYLRCQLARIYHGTKLVPSLNHYTIEDPENPFKQFVPNEKPKQFKHSDLVSLKNWIHYPPSILKQGRVSHFIEPPDEADPEEYRKKEMEKDPFEKRIKPVTEDKELVMNSFSNIKICPWKLIQTFEDKVYTNPYIKLLDETQPDFDPLEQKDNKVDYTIICVKSLLWPGAYNFYLNKESYFFYFGDGLKFVDTQKDGPFVYKSFPILPKDFDDLPDQPEPTIPPKEEGEEGEEGEEENKEENKEGEQEAEKE